MRTGLIFDIKRFSVHDGPGIRTTVFFKGCPLSCWWCHNPESRDPFPFLHYDASKCVGCHDCVTACPEGAVTATPEGSHTDPGLCLGHGACAGACPSEARQLIGRYYTVDDLMREIERDRVFYDESGGGVTFSGGEPLRQWEFLVEVLRACGAQGIHRALDTTGVTSEDVLLAVAAETDLFLYDLKTLDPEVHQEATGVPLQPILDNLHTLLEAGAKVRIRVPVIPGVTDGDNIDRTASFVKGLPDVDGVHLLPYHTPARAKHLKFGIPWHLPDELSTSQTDIDGLVERMNRHGVSVTVGG